MIRVKVPSGVKLMPHKHPEDRIYTVMSGVFYIGLGESVGSGSRKSSKNSKAIRIETGETSRGIRRSFVRWKSRRNLM